MKSLFIFGTRPEAIKLAPLIQTLKKAPRDFETKVCVTAQHRDMLDQVLSFFGIAPDFDLNVMKPNQSLYDITADSLKGLQTVLKDFEPENVIVQGDATSAFVGALAAYYAGVRISHVEAGLRSGQKRVPFPEEANRILTGHLADYHFAPTQGARANLLAEGITDNIWIVGNTVIDALFLGLELIKQDTKGQYSKAFRYLDFSQRIVLITGHRRESFGKPFESIATAIKQLAQTFPEVQFVYPVHLNPNVQEPIRRLLGQVANVHLISPLDYPHFIWLMDKAYLILTDSGGIQEEAPSLGKPVLVMRDVTERVEGIQAGTAKLIGTKREVIVREVSTLLTDAHTYSDMAQAENPYGDGTASQQIAQILREIH
jgi:UDP-N-acetylglucosamine 2-epimerase (non-hydrolysing)